MTPMYGTVTRTTRLSSSMIRIEFTGAGLDAFSPTGYTDEYVNALFLPSGAAYSPPFDVETARGFPVEARPRPRRFTVRNWDADERVLTIDFVTHGDVGFAGTWAQAAEPGDRLQMSGPSGGYHPDPDADWYLLAGDESALPAISRSLQSVPPTKACVAFVLVDDPTHEIHVIPSDGRRITWLHRSQSGSPETLLRDSVADLSWRPGTVDVFVHGEAGEVRETRKHLIAERGLDKEAMSVSPYWRRDHNDEAWRATEEAVASGSRKRRLNSLLGDVHRERCSTPTIV